VLDLTTIVLGPYATRFLGDLGAEVIKVEAPDGDLFRMVEPSRSPGMGAAFMAANRNKRSLAVDLRSPEGQEILKRLITRADIVIHNMRPKAAARLGLSYDAVRAINPRAVYCFAPGYGSDGPYSDAPAYDDPIQAAAGAAAINADDTGEPRFFPTIIGDKVAGMHLAIAALSGLASREATGRGCCIEAPMFESLVSLLLLEHLQGESFEPPTGPMGYARLTSRYRKPFRTSDGHISILPYNATHWRSFLALAGMTERGDRLNIDDPTERSLVIDQLYQLIDEAAPTRTTNEWLADLRARDIPCAPVNDLADLLKDPHLSAVEMFPTFDHPSEGRMRAVRSPLRVAGIEDLPDVPAPRLGEDTGAILAELRYDAVEISALRACGAVQVAASRPADLAEGGR
jgi:crotonobetainyl-CoA:carnitine CoA-transferase CaiB-like acyl-CoA transferase